MSTVVWSYGGGVQSIALAALIVDGALPCPDIAVFADTGREVSTTFTYMNDIVAPALLEMDLEIQIIGTDYTHAKYDILKSDRVLLPMYTTQNGKKGMMPTFCSNEWKRRPIQRWLRDNGINDCDVWLGISMDEIDRMKPSGLQWLRHSYPLIEMLPRTREQCLEIVAAHGWPAPAKSRCWMCPHQSPQAWQDLRRDFPDEFDKAVNLENEVRKIDPHAWMHRFAIPLLDAVELSAPGSEQMDGCDSGYCMV